MKCARCKYSWLPCGHREIRDMFYMTDIGICPVCRNAKSRLRIATPGDMANAMLWGAKFELVRGEEGK
jgi:hypothetical protein